MDQRTARDIAKRLERIERRSTRLRLGTVTDTSPLTIELGGSGIPQTARQLDVTLAVDDVVAVLVFGHDMLVLGKVV